ncbi:chorismate mutase [Geosporobacter subterraneus DSM 17957]|uniref:UPF0735 ACT domain-containing protein SAMN02745975_01917 n=1 Tax=Geosporobacter subterraneus DSM 17957 TaxID=1121919 RepID=A0A1M6IPR7_9FIRM|nr:ACT domain-containing protein [Geosporobacter subterraneus]SHJ36349.1 chorismate mutase [Geosporobacter subterraneus DSM 17957]
MADKKYLIIDTEILPEVYEKVLEVKELLRTGRAKGITEAVQMIGISRSTFYKYKDFIFSSSEGTKGQKVTVTLLLSHTPGILSNLLNKLAFWNVNILTINQDIPINNVANVSITFDISEAKTGIDDLMEGLSSIKGVVKAELIAME